MSRTSTYHLYCVAVIGLVFQEEGFVVCLCQKPFAIIIITICHTCYIFPGNNICIRIIISVPVFFINVFFPSFGKRTIIVLQCELIA